MASAPPRPVTVLRVAAGLVAVVAVAAAGCRSSNAGRDDARASTASAGTFSDAAGAAMRIEAMAAADVYVSVIVQAHDDLRRRTQRPDVAKWALAQKIAATTAAFTSAAQTSDAASLLDILVLAKLKRHAIEEHWMDALLHDEGAALLTAYQRGELEMWAAAEKVLTRPQLDELRTLIDEWRREHPGQYYVSHVRLVEIADSKKLGRDSPQVKLPGSVFGLLYMDPLAGLDPVARELRSYRALTERMVYLAVRMPLVLGAQVEYAADGATGTPEVVRFVGASERFADGVTRMAGTLAKYPQDLAAERTAAIDQAAAALAAERTALVTQLESQESRLRQMMSDATGLVARIDQAGASINTSTSQTVATTEDATRRTLDHAFRLALVLLIVVLLGVPLSVLLVGLGRAKTRERARGAGRTQHLEISSPAASPDR